MQNTDWDSRVSHPIQTEAWGQFRQENGNLVSKISGDHNYLVVWSKIPLLNKYFGTLLKCPIPTPQDIRLLSAEAKKMHGIGIRMEPDVLKDSGFMIQDARIVPGRRFFTPKTYWLDLTKTENELLAAMHPKARYNIRLAQKKGVVVKEDNSDAAFADYLRLSQETWNRQRFFAHGSKYHMLMWKNLKNRIAHLFTASYQNKVLAAWVIFKHKDKIYYPYGGSTNEHKEVQAPSLMLWETAMWGKTQGCKIYDLWGVEAGKGFTDFKAKFNPELVEFIGTYDLIIDPSLYWLFRLSENLRWLILGSLKALPTIFKH